MKISAKTEYACIAMLELAASYGSGDPVRIRSIADEHGIPSRFLVQILLQLKGAGFVTSTRGASGGYQLVKPPEEISLADVMHVIDGAEEPIVSSASPDSLPGKVLRAAWQEVADVQQEMLRAINFAELIERAQKQAENMYYI
ncbi:MAG TPA: Rrf2 family transcriptional regulator [Pirellulales bacterium]|nr:Rrf2 family transcriptional regulator [Pirellulales bacterium]